TWDTYLNKNDQLANSDKDSSLHFPPGFTPNSVTNSIDSKKESAPLHRDQEMQTDLLNSRVVENSQVADEYHSSDSQGLKRKLKTGGSILDILDIMINIGHTMGYTMEGCVKDMEKIIESQGVRDVSNELSFFKYSRLGIQSQKRLDPGVVYQT
nr:hypothetical protein [Tanacetum cinerariifolium]